MKITANQLRRIIKEEVGKTLNETSAEFSKEDMLLQDVGRLLHRVGISGRSMRIENNEVVVYPSSGKLEPALKRLRELGYSPSAHIAEDGRIKIQTGVFVDQILGKGV